LTEKLVAVAIYCAKMCKKYGSDTKYRNIDIIILKATKIITKTQHICSHFKILLS